MHTSVEDTCVFFSFWLRVMQNQELRFWSGDPSVFHQSSGDICWAFAILELLLLPNCLPASHIIAPALPNVTWAAVYPALLLYNHEMVSLLRTTKHMIFKRFFLFFSTVPSFFGLCCLFHFLDREYQLHHRHFIHQQQRNFVSGLARQQRRFVHQTVDSYQSLHHRHFNRISFPLF